MAYGGNSLSMIKDPIVAAAEWEGRMTEGKMNDIHKVTLTTVMPVDERDKGRNQIRGSCKNPGEG